MLLNTFHLDKIRNKQFKAIAKICSKTLQLEFSGGVFHMLIALANSLDPDHGGQNVGPDLVPNILTP